ncbi:DNA replication protein [Rhizobium leguminosarum bv. viciae WSM1455]|nr:DNA replication protein [Rhizobium leguminosarum bv. viciae WSM1455]
MRRLGVTRRQVFERVERAALASLPGETTNSPNGVWSVSRPIITSSSKASFIPSPMPSFASRSILEQRREPSRSFTAASASPSISAAMAAVVMEPTQITCPVPTGDTLSGYQIAFGAGAHPSVKACREDFSVAYHRVPRLFATLALARGDGRYGRIPKSIAKTDLLILDDWDRKNSAMISAAIFSRSSKTATSVARRSSQARCPWIAGGKLFQTQRRRCDTGSPRSQRRGIDLIGESMRKQRSPMALETQQSLTWHKTRSKHQTDPGSARKMAGFKSESVAGFIGIRTQCNI